MPIFHDPHDSPPRQASPRLTSFGGRRSEQSPETVPEVPSFHGEYSWDSYDSQIRPSMESESRGSGPLQANLGRVELIERLKRTKSPSWQRSQDVSHETVAIANCATPRARVRMLTISCSSTTTLNSSLRPALEIARRVHRHHHLMTESHDCPRQTLFETPLLQVWRSNGLDLPYTPVTSGNGKRTQALGAILQPHHTSQLRLWFHGVAHSRLQRFRPHAMSRHTALGAPLARNRMQSHELVPFHSRPQAHLPFCHLRARSFTKRTTLTSTSRLSQAHDKFQEAPTATIDVTRFRLHLFRAIRLLPSLGRYLVRRRLGIYDMVAPYLIKRTNQDVL